MFCLPHLDMPPKSVDELFVNNLAVAVCVYRVYHSLGLLLGQTEAEPVDCLLKLLDADATGSILVHGFKQRPRIIQLLAEQRPLALDGVQHHLDHARVLRLPSLRSAFLLGLLIVGLLRLVQ